MDSTNFYLRLKYLGACTAAQDWVLEQLDTEKTAEGIWNKCERTDWLWWLTVKNVARREFPRVAAIDAIRLHGMFNARDTYVWEWLASACARGASREIDRNIRPMTQELRGFMPVSVLNAALDRDYGYIFRRLTDGDYDTSRMARADLVRKYVPWQKIQRGFRKWER